MSFFVTGDCHGNWTKLLYLHLSDDLRQKLIGDVTEKRPQLKAEDYICVLGDFGIWSYDAEEEYELDRLSNMTYTILFVDGNHSNFDKLNKYPVVDYHGGKAHKIRDNVYHLMRGYVFDFDDKKFFCFGGAQSHDIRDGILDPKDFNSYDELRETIMLYRWRRYQYRIKGISWWPEELPSEEELQRARNSLAEVDYKVDYVLSHCCPASIAAMMRYYENDILTDFFDEIAYRLDFDHWYFGHYHCNMQLTPKYTVLYEDYKELF